MKQNCTNKAIAAFVLFACSGLPAATGDDQSAIQAMLQTLGKAAKPRADDAPPPAESDASAKRKTTECLVEAVQRGDLENVKAALAADVDPNGPADQLTALHLAVASRISDGETVEPTAEIAQTAHPKWRCPTKEF